ncbi:MAG: zinc ribbon domain-containing protein [Clostridiales bacterium]|nr:zinc ribbon domain-containing protein [Clostridiales bacterium]
MAIVCGSCGYTMENGSAFCPRCGEKIQMKPKVEAPAPAPMAAPAPVAPAPIPAPPAPAQTAAPVPAPTAAPTTPAPAPNIDTQTSTAPGAPGTFQTPSHYSIPADAWLVDPNEKIKFSLKNGYLINVISNEGFISEDAVITDKRLYYNITSMGLVKYRTEMKIDLEDITATTITDSNPVVLLVLAAFTGLTSIMMSISKAPVGLWIGFLVAALILVCYWYMLRKTYFKIEYAGGSVNGFQPSGSLYFSVKKYGMDAVRNFQRELHLAKSDLNAKRYKM